MDAFVTDRPPEVLTDVLTAELQHPNTGFQREFEPARQWGFCRSSSRVHVCARREQRLRKIVRGEVGVREWGGVGRREG